MAKGSFSFMGGRAAARIQSSTCRSHGGVTPAGSFAARAQSAAARNGSTGTGRSGPAQSGGGQGTTASP